MDINQTLVLLGCDRTNLRSHFVSTLISESPENCSGSDDGVKIYTWKPKHSYITDKLLNDIAPTIGDVTVKFVIPTLRKPCWNIVQSCFRSDQLFLLVYTVDADIPEILQWASLIRAKIPNGRILLMSCGPVVTNGGIDISTEPPLILANLETQQDEWIDCCKSLIDRHKAYESDLVNHLLKKWKDLRDAQLQIYQQVLHFDIINYKPQELERITRLLLTYITKSSGLITEEKVANQILKYEEELKEQGIEGVTPTSVVHLSLESHHDSTCTLPNQTEDTVMSDLQLDVANMACLIHIDTLDKAFRFEANRFWPKGVALKKPTPELLVKVLEEIPNQGYIREVIFPLLWQTYNYSEVKILNHINRLKSEGWLCASYSDETTGVVSVGNPIDGLYSLLKMPNYPILSTDTKYHLPLLNPLSSRLKPAVNWSDLLPEGDTQLDIIFTFPCVGLLSSQLDLIISKCFNECQESATYKYLWRKGFLFKVHSEVTCHIYYTDEQVLHVCSRSHEPLTTILWFSLRTLLIAVGSALDQFPGLLYKVDISSAGYPLVTRCDEAMQTKPPGNMTFKLSIQELIAALDSSTKYLHNDSYQLNMELLLLPLSKQPRFQSCGLFESLIPNVSVKDLIEINLKAPVLADLQYKENSALIGSSSYKKGMSKSVNWRAQLSEEVDMANKEYMESHQPVTITNLAMRKQIRKIASSIVTSAIASAVVTVLSKQGSTTPNKTPMIDIVANAVKAGCDGDVQGAVNSINQIIRMSQTQTDHRHLERKSKVCILL